jgi:hypothetical protein
MGMGNPGVTLTLTLEYPYLQLGLGYSTGAGKGLVGFQGYKACIMSYSLFEEDIDIYKFNHNLHNSTQHLDGHRQLHQADLQWL